MNDSPQLPLPAEADISKGLEKAAEADREGKLVYETAVAGRNGLYVTLQVYETEKGRLTHVNISGAGRRSAPMVFDTNQLNAFIGGLQACFGVRLAPWSVVEHMAAA